MRNSFSHLSINSKMLFILLFSSFSSLLLGGLFLMLLEISDFRNSTKEDLVALVNLVANRSTAALMFEDNNLANENLAVFASYPVVQSACLYKADGSIFAHFFKSGIPHSTCPESIKKLHTQFVNFDLYVIQPIILDSVEIGSAYLYANLRQAYWRKVQFTLMIFAVLIAVSALTFLLSKPLLKYISEPLKKLVDTVKNITYTQDYSLRAVKTHNDELGVLVDVFNGLINTVEAQNIALTQAKDRYQVLFDDNPTMIFNVDSKHNIIISANDTAATRLGLTVAEIQESIIFDIIHAEDVANLEALFECCISNPLLIYKQEIRMLCPSNQNIWVRATARLMENENQADSLLLVCEDITEMHFLNEKIAYQASYDELTGLVNRNQFDTFCKQVATLARINHTEHALCYLDLDQFKVINDTCGHLAGDELLKQLGEIFKKNVRHDDYVARLGGDEFGILMNNCSLNQSIQACEKLLEIISGFHFVWEDKQFSIGASIGITAITANTKNAINSLKEADAACFIAKDKGRNRIHVFHSDDEELAMRQGEMQWIEKIQLGLEQNRFCLYGQPIVSIVDYGEKLHFETLLRYRDENGRIIGPNEFLPSAERYNLAPAIDRWVIRNLFEWIASKPAFMTELSLCSVNLSGRSLSDETMLEYITEQFTYWKIPTNKICFEVTETAAIDNIIGATNFINKLRSKGCLFSLDDFGSGLSSFSYLKNLPVDFLKIDGVFVKDIVNDRFDFAMVKSITEVGHVMSKKTVAEFVENENIFNLLSGLGVDYVQGYGIGKPVPLDQLKLSRPFAKRAD